MKLTNKELLVIKGFDGILGFEVGGMLNAIEDGGMTKEEFKDEVTKESLVLTLEYELKEAYKRGYLEIGDYRTLMEAKHIKFLGKKRLKELMEISAEKMMRDSDVVDMLKG